MSRFGRFAGKSARSIAALTVLAVGSLALGAVQPVAATTPGNTMTTTVTGGSLSASINSDDALDFGDIASSYDGDNYGYAYGTLRVIDATATGAGWSVTAIASDLDYLGANPGGEDIPAENISVRAQGSVSVNGGMNEDPTGGPNKLSGADLLDSEVTLLQANTGYGMGDYSIDFEFELAVPQYARVGAYSGTLTVTIVPNVPN